jgi:hypothetical protein
VPECTNQGPPPMDALRDTPRHVGRRSCALVLILVLVLVLVLVLSALGLDSTPPCAHAHLPLITICHSAALIASHHHC